LAVLNQKDLAEVVDHFRDTAETPRDDDDCEYEHGNEFADKLKIKQQNNRAYALLVVSLATYTDQKKIAFDTVAAMVRDDAYANGCFKKAWLDLKELLRPQTMVTLSKLTADYKMSKMNTGIHQPSSW